MEQQQTHREHNRNNTMCIKFKKVKAATSLSETQPCDLFSAFLSLLDFETVDAFISVQSCCNQLLFSSKLPQTPGTSALFLIWTFFLISYFSSIFFFIFPSQTTCCSSFMELLRASFSSRRTGGRIRKRKRKVSQNQMLKLF